MIDHEPYEYCCPEHYPLRSMTGLKPTGAYISDHLLTEYERAEVAKAVRYLQDKHISFEGIKMFEEVAMSRKYLLWPVRMRLMWKVRPTFGKGKIDRLICQHGNIQYLGWDLMLGKLHISFGMR